MRNPKRGLFFVCLLLVLFMVSHSLAMTQSEWDRQCINKTSASATVYGSSSRDSVVTTLSAGTYVKQSGFDPQSNLWRISFYQGGSVGSGYVESGLLTVAVAHVSVDDGSTENIPESMSGDYDAIAAYLNAQYSDRTFSYTGSGIHVQYLNSDGEESGSAARQVTIRQSEIIPVPEELQKIVQLGSQWSIVQEEGVLKAVETSTISFSTTVKPSEQIAVIYASRKGEVTMHTQPRVNSSVLCKIPTGSVVGVIKKGNTYTRIFYDGQVGCVLSSTIRDLDMSASALGTGILTYDNRVVRGEDINVRSGASGQARVVDSWATGTEVQVWSHQKSFYEIEYQGMRAYVNDRFLTVSENEDPSWVTGDDESLKATLEALSRNRPKKSGSVKKADTANTAEENTDDLNHPASYGADDLNQTPGGYLPQDFPGGTP